MEVRVWRSFSCNNSGRFHLVAEFPSEERAVETAETLRRHLAEAEGEREGMTNEERWSNEGVTEAGIAFGIEHGIDWPGWIVTGDGEDEELEIEHAGAAVVVSHIYCHGFHDHLGAYFRASGGHVTQQLHGGPAVSLIAELPADRGVADALVAELDRMFGAGGYLHIEGHAPWSPTERDDASGFNDGAWVGYHGPFYVKTLPLLRDLLESRAPNHRLTLDRYDDVARFRHIGTARCPECNRAPMRFIEARRHELDADQLACTACGGMFAVAP